MGKSNRIRASHAEKSIATPIKPKNKTGMPLWLKTTIAAVLAAVILLTCIFGVLAANGVMMRYRYPVRSENFKFSGNMMSYLYKTQYQNFTQQYSSYMNYFSLDPSEPLKDQKFGDTSSGYGYETQFLGQFDGTWFDYFMNLATNQAKQTLIYCEEANARGITLDDADKAELDQSIETIKSTAAIYGYTANSYVSTMYGKGVSLKDVKKVMELSMLAQKCLTTISEEISNGITDTDIQNAYTAAPDKFDLIDYSYYTIKVDFDEVADEILGSDHTDAELKENKDKVLEAYKKKIAEAKELADKFKALTSVDDFNKSLYEQVAMDAYEAAYKKLNLKEEVLPEEAIRATVNKAVVDAVVAEVLEGKTETAKALVEADGTYKVYDQTVSKEFAEAADSIRADVFKATLEAKTTYIIEKAGYSESDEFLKWAFEAGRVQNETKTVFTGDGSKEGDISDDDGYFNASVYILKSTRSRDESLTKDVAYMMFSTEAAAKEAIEAFKAGTISLEAFEKVATDKSASTSSKFEDYVKGSVGVEDFDKWLYDEKTVLNSYTETPVKVSDESFIVAYYYGDGEANWNITVKSSIYDERFEAKYKDMEAKFAVTVKDNVINKIAG